MHSGFETPSFEAFRTHRPDIDLDTSRLVVEILGAQESAQKEFDSSNYFAKSIVFWGNKAFLLRYKDKKTQKYYPVAYMSYEEDANGDIHIIAIQWTKERKVSYRVYSTFRVFDFFLKLVEENFSRKGKKVTIDDMPDGLESVGEKTRASERYEVFQRQLWILNNWMSR